MRKLLDILSLHRERVDAFAVLEAERELARLGASAKRSSLVDFYRSRGQLRSLVEHVGTRGIRGDVGDDVVGLAWATAPDQSANPRLVAPMKTALVRCIGICFWVGLFATIFYLQGLRANVAAHFGPFPWGAIGLVVAISCGLVALHAFVASRVGVISARLWVYGPASVIAALVVAWMIRHAA